MGPPPILTTPRLILRPYRPEDRTAFLALFTDPEVTRHTGGPLAPARAERLLAAVIAGDHTRIVSAWAVVDRETKHYLGNGTLLRNRDLGEFEIGYLLVRGAWGRGLATEIARALIAHTHRHLGHGRVIATVDTDHLASRRVCEKSGMRFLRRGHDDDGDYMIYMHEG